MGYTEDQKYWIWLASVSGLGPRRFDLLLDRVGPPQQVWEELGPWMRDLLGGQVYAALSRARSAAYLDTLFDMLERSGAVAVTRVDPEYPARLRAIIDPPPALFVRGRVALQDARTLAIVGARNSTAYGMRMARRLARELSRQGVTVVSGLARGVDSAAHRGAVDAGARTVAVLGSGVDVIYPPEHLMLADEILQNGGSIISELQPGTAPLRQHFPARNRIISGMCEGVLLVEGAKKSGAMSTVGFAMEQGREVLALPGQADSPLSTSTHTLIREGARLITSAEDICEDMGWQPAQEMSTQGIHHTTRALPLTQAEQNAYNLLAGGPVDTDALVEALGMPPSEVGALLTVMELQGLVRKLPGRRIERIGPDA